MMDLWNAVAQCLFERFERQRLTQVLTDLIGSDHSGENIHGQADIDKASLETNMGNIRHPDLIPLRDLKGFESVVSRLGILRRLGFRHARLTATNRLWVLINRATRRVPTVYPIRSSNCVMYLIRISDTVQRVFLFQIVGHLRTDPLWFDNRNCCG